MHSCENRSNKMPPAPNKRVTNEGEKLPERKRDVPVDLVASSSTGSIVFVPLFSAVLISVVTYSDTTASISLNHRELGEVRVQPLYCRRSVLV